MSKANGTTPTGKVRPAWADSSAQEQEQTLGEQEAARSAAPEPLYQVFPSRRTASRMPSPCEPRAGLIAQASGMSRLGLKSATCW